MKNMMTHKGYTGSAHYDDDGPDFYGKIEFIRDLVSYKGTDVDSLRSAFEEAVDDYLDRCRQEGRQPDSHSKAVLMCGWVANCIGGQPYTPRKKVQTSTKWSKRRWSGIWMARLAEFGNE